MEEKLILACVQARARARQGGAGTGNHRAVYKWSTKGSEATRYGAARRWDARTPGRAFICFGLIRKRRHRVRPLTRLRSRATVRQTRRPVSCVVVECWSSCRKSRRCAAAVAVVVVLVGIVALAAAGYPAPRFRCRRCRRCRLGRRRRCLQFVVH